MSELDNESRSLSKKQNPGFVHSPYTGLNLWVVKVSSDYLVYVYLDPRLPGKYFYNSWYFDYEPFYVGKGTEYRVEFHYWKALSTAGHSTSRKINRIRSIIKCSQKPIIYRVRENLLEDDAFSLERELIKLIGRKDLERGPLLNLTDGGEGSSGKIVSKETRDNIRVHHWANQETYKPEDHPSYGMVRNQEWRDKIRDKAIGRLHSEETKENIRNKLIGKKFSDETLLCRSTNRAHNKSISLGFDSDEHAVLEINRMHNEGIPVNAIVSKLNCSLNYVRRRIFSSPYFSDRYQHLKDANAVTS